MKYVLGIGAVFALVWLPGSGCCHAPPPQTPPHQFGGYHGAPAQPHYPQSSGAGVQQYPGATGVSPSQTPGTQPYQAPAGEVEQVMPDSSPMQGR